MFEMIERIPDAVTSEYRNWCKAFLVFGVIEGGKIVSDKSTSIADPLAVETSDRDHLPPHRLRLSHQFRLVLIGH